jgi:hypothetical protein
MQNESALIFKEIKKIQEQCKQSEPTQELLDTYSLKLDLLKKSHCEKLQRKHLISTPNDIRKYRGGLVTDVSFESAFAWPVVCSDCTYEWTRQMKIWRAHGTLTVIEFGTFVQYFEDGDWIPYNRQGQPGNNAEFSKQFSCAHGIVTPQTTFTSQQQISKSSLLRSAKVFWYAIGVNEHGHLDGDGVVMNERDFIPTLAYPYDHIESSDLNSFPFKHFQEHPHFFNVDWREGEDWILTNFSRSAKVAESDISLDWDDAKEMMFAIVRNQKIPVKRPDFSTQHSMLLLLQKVYESTLSIRFLNHVTLADDTAWFAVETAETWNNLEKNYPLVSHFFTPIDILPDIFSSPSKKIAEVGIQYADSKRGDSSRT